MSVCETVLGEDTATTGCAFVFRISVVPIALRTCLASTIATTRVFARDHIASAILASLELLARPGPVQIRVELVSVLEDVADVQRGLVERIAVPFCARTHAPIMETA